MSVFRLALLLGKTVSELDMSWREFTCWQEYLKLEPPEKGNNDRLAILLAQITNMSGRSLADGKRVSVQDFISGPKQQTMGEQIQFMKQLG